MYYLSKFDDAISSGFGVIPKIIPANLCKPIHGIINYFNSNVERKVKIFKKLNILRTKRASQMKCKTSFTVFEGLSSGEYIET